MTLKKFYFIFFLIFVILLGSFNTEGLYSKIKKKTPVTKTKTKAKNKSKSKTSGKKKKKRRRIRAVRPVKMVYPANFEVIKDTLLSDGVTYKKLYWGKKFQHHINLIELDRKIAGNKITVLKAGNQVNELQKLHDIISNYEVANHEKIFGAVNANFWAAYSNIPIGPTVINGEVIEFFTHKRWSAGFFDSAGKLFIDNYYLSAEIQSKKGPSFYITSVNRRRDSNGVVLYNKYAGNTIPYIPDYRMDDEYADALAEATLETEFIDSTDIELDTLALKDEILKNRQISSIEYGLPKVTLIYLSNPAVNKEVKCIVKSIDAGGVKMPENGCIVSLGRDINHSFFPKTGDTLSILFTTNVNENIQFINAVAGTPRLVHDGLAKHEAIYEGSHGSRFIHQQLPRTAIGTNEEGDKIYIVTVEGTASAAKKAGADLQQMSLIMKKIGAYNAMNLDGGGSSLMVIDGKNIMSAANPEHSRRISVGFGISAKKR